MTTNTQVDRPVYLPAGVWYDYWTHQRHEGAQEIVWSEDDQGVIPLFVREGAIVPKLLHVPQTLLTADQVGNPDVSTPSDDWAIEVWPTPGNASLTAYDGTSVTVAPDRGTLDIILEGAARTVIYEILSAPPEAVHWDDEALTELADAQALERAAYGWAIDGDRLLAKVPHAAGTSVLRVFYAPGGADTGDGSAGGSTTASSGPSSASATAATYSSTSGDSETDSSNQDSDRAGGCGCRAQVPALPPILHTLTLLIFAGVRRTRRVPTHGERR
jgi:hypothetical protein